MKNSRNLFLFLMGMSAIFLLGGIVSQDLFAKTMGSKDVEFKDGGWNEGAKIYILNGIPTLPLKARIDGSQLFIQSNTRRSDITICVSKEGTVIYEETVPKTETQLIIINLEHSGTGDYQLELENQWGDYLNGSFAIE